MNEKLIMINKLESGLRLLFKEKSAHFAEESKEEHVELSWNSVSSLQFEVSRSGVGNPRP
jgi:hypothetical protein